MDLLDFEAEALYFDDPLPEDVAELLDEAAGAYAEQRAEQPLLRAYFLQPEHLTVLVALYRYYYYQHRYPDAFLVAVRAMDTVARQLELCCDWQTLTPQTLAGAVTRSMTLTRFYLMALKGSAYLKLRMGAAEEGLARLEKVAELDADDRIGVRSLLEIARREHRRRQLSAHPNVVTI
jgi:hypothetical protein